MSTDAIAAIPEHLRDVLTISEIDDAGLLAGDLFRRKYATEPPDVGRHLVALYRGDESHWRVAGYSHMRVFGEVYLSGGSCTDGATMRAMHPQHREAISAAGGILHLILNYAFARYAGCCDAFFGHCGDARALEVTRAVGFVDAGPRHLIVRWHKPLHPNIRRALVAKVEALGPF